MKHLFIGLVKLYRKFISPHKRPCCRFTPSCSQYAIEAFEEWGAVAGLGLTLWRIVRCNPLCKGGHDPVPKRNRRTAQRGKTDPDHICDDDSAVS